MIRYLSLVVLAAFCAGAGSSAERSLTSIDFSDEDVGQWVHRDGRQSLDTSAGYVLLRGSGWTFTRDSFGPGEYHVRFSLHEPEDFQYHAYRVVLFGQDPTDPDSDRYELMWRPHGEIYFRQVVDGERTTDMRFIDGGRDNPNRIEPGEPVDLTLRVPAEGDGVYVYCWQTDSSGEPTTAFKLSGEVPLEGAFGVHNSKWYSHVRVHQMSYRPLDE